jgi:predicted SnoaL-like aldol condensation-catalyzing enzyme
MIPAMTRQPALAFLLVLLVLLAAAPAPAQVPVTRHPDPESLFTDKDPQLHANKQVVMHIVRDLLEANHWDEASKWIAPEYVQHNPNVPTGLAAVMKFFGSRKPTPIPDRKSWRTPVVAVTASGDIVTVAFVREYDDPRKPGAKYTTTWFDMWRIRDGKAVEHWDPALIAPPAR